MKILKYFLCATMMFSFGTYAQNEIKPERQPGHTNENKFKQLYEEFSTPNV